LSEGLLSGGKKGVVIGDEETTLLFKALGFKTVLAKNEKEVINSLRSIAQDETYGLAIVVKHVIENEERVREEARRLGLPVLILPTIKSPSKPININVLIARALGFG
jgi:vacuolar-type H+-ATPase subunit F/Vma7